MQLWQSSDISNNSLYYLEGKNLGSFSTNNLKESGLTLILRFSVISFIYICKLYVFNPFCLVLCFSLAYYVWSLLRVFAIFLLLDDPSLRSSLPTFPSSLILIKSFHPQYPSFFVQICFIFVSSQVLQISETFEIFYILHKNILSVIIISLSTTDSERNINITSKGRVK